MINRLVSLSVHSAGVHEGTSLRFNYPYELKLGQSTSEKHHKIKADLKLKNWGGGGRGALIPHRCSPKTCHALP